MYYIIYMANEVEQMIFTAAVFCNTSAAEIARAMGMAPQNFYRKMKQANFKPEEFSKIAKILGAEFVYYFSFPNGSKVGTLHQDHRPRFPSATPKMPKHPGKKKKTNIRTA